MTSVTTDYTVTSTGGLPAISAEGAFLPTGEVAPPLGDLLVERGIPVMSHVGLRPQSQHVMGGFRARGRSRSVADEIVANAVACADAGSFAVVVEGVAEDLAEKVTQAVDIPTIGIGAGAGCDGQILVTPDMLGMFERVPKFVKKYSNLRKTVEASVKAYAEDVRTREFPGRAQTYTFKSGSKD